MIGNLQSILKPAGFLSRWLDYCEPFEFPDSYALYSLLACASAAINGRIIVNPVTEPSPHPNVFVVLYGPSGARKGSAMRQALGLLSEAVPDTPVLPDDFTMEALWSELSKQSQESGRCAGLVVQEEFADLIGGADYALRNSKLLTKLWDCRPVATRLTHAHSLETVKNPYITMLASSSPDWLETVDPKTLAGGFLRRLLLIVEYTPKRRNASPVKNKELFRTLANVMRGRLNRGAFTSSHMMLQRDAKECMDNWYHTKVQDVWSSSDERLGHFASCMQAHMLKVAALINVFEGEGAEWLTLDSVTTSMSLIERLLPGLSQAYASLVPTPYARLRAVILRTVLGMGSCGLSDAALDRAVINAAGVRPKDAMEARMVLIQQGLLVRDPGTGMLIVRREG